MYLSDHPLRRIAGELQQRVDTTINELGAHLDGLIVQVGGAIRDMRTFIPRRSTTGQRMAALQIEDLTGQRRGGGVRARVRGVRARAASRRGDRGARQGRGRAQCQRRWNARRRSRRRRTASTSSRRRSSPRRCTRMTIRASPTWRRDSTVHVSVSAAADRHVSARSGTRSRSIRAIARSSSTSTRARASTRSRLRVDFAVDPGPALERAVEILVGESSYSGGDAPRARPRTGARSGTSLSAARSDRV